MKYYYDVIFYLADEEKRKEINLMEWRNIFKDAEIHYNQTAKNARNIKRIVETKVTEKEIKIRLESNSPLEKPTLALRSFSQYLVQTSFGNIAANNNALFRGSFSVVETEEVDMTGPEMIKTLAEILLARRKADTGLISSIKTQLINWRDNQ